MITIATVLAVCVGATVTPPLEPETARAQAEAPILQARAEQIAAQVGPLPEWPDDLFHPELFKAISPAQLRAVFIDYHASCGRAVRTVPLASGSRSGDGSFDGRFRIDFDRDREVVLTLRLEPAPPHRVSALFFTAPTPSLPDFAALGNELAALPGTASLVVARLTDDGPDPIYEYQPDVLLGIGSAFKLYVLGALVADVAGERRSWNDTLVLSARSRSLPSGILQTWPAGSPVTLHTLATLMISRSDNTATDHLIELLGRVRIEEMLAEMGHAHPGRNQPLLTTRELFLLRGAGGGAHAARFLALDAAERRAYLTATLAKIPLNNVDPLLIALPEHSTSIEWFASTRDLCLALDWLRRATEAGATATARDLMAVNLGPASAPATNAAGRSELKYVGYKGGSTGGVLNHTWLVRMRDGAWIGVAITWNDPAATLDPERFGGLASRALQLATTQTTEVRAKEASSSQGR
jgi:hypothetical protein